MSKIDRKQLEIDIKEIVIDNVFEQNTPELRNKIKNSIEVLYPSTTATIIPREDIDGLKIHVRGYDQGQIIDYIIEHSLFGPSNNNVYTDKVDEQSVNIQLQPTPTRHIDFDRFTKEDVENVPNVWDQLRDQQISQIKQAFNQAQHADVPVTTYPTQDYIDRLDTGTNAQDELSQDDIIRNIKEVITKALNCNGVISSLPDYTATVNQPAGTNRGVAIHSSGSNSNSFYIWPTNNSNGNTSTENEDHETMMRMRLPELTLNKYNVHSNIIFKQVNQIVEDTYDEIDWSNEYGRGQYIKFLENYLQEYFYEPGKITQFEVICDHRNNDNDDMYRGRVNLRVQYWQTHCITKTTLDYRIR